MEMVQSRSLTSHAYNETTAARVVAAIRDTYFTEFQTLHTKLERLRQEEVS